MGGLESILQLEFEATLGNALLEDPLGDTQPTQFCTLATSQAFEESRSNVLCLLEGSAGLARTEERADVVGECGEGDGEDGRRQERRPAEPAGPGPGHLARLTGLAPRAPVRQEEAETQQADRRPDEWPPPRLEER